MTNAAVRTIKPRGLKDGRMFDVANYSLMFILCLFVAYPLYYILVGSFTDPVVVNTGRLLLYPEKLYLDGYKEVFTYPKIWSGYLNTILYTVVGTIISVGSTVTAGYALSRRDLYGRRPIMLLFIFTMFFSGGMIPLYLQVKSLGLYDSLWAITLPGAVSVYNLIVCRSFFESTLPDELLEASIIDGCNDFTFFFRIAVPLSKTIITVMVLFYATNLWNSFMPALLYLSDANKMPLQVVLRDLILQNQVASMASSSATAAAEREKLASQLKFGIIIVSAAPLLMLYPFMQKYMLKGVMIGAVKG